MEEEPGDDAEERPDHRGAHRLPARLDPTRGEQDDRHDEEVVHRVLEAAHQPPGLGRGNGKLRRDPAPVPAPREHEIEREDTVEHHGPPGQDLRDHFAPVEGQHAHPGEHDEEPDAVGDAEALLNDLARRGADDGQDQDEHEDEQDLERDPAPAEELLEEAPVVVDPEDPREFVRQTQDQRPAEDRDRHPEHATQCAEPGEVLDDLPTRAVPAPDHRGLEDHARNEVDPDQTGSSQPHGGDSDLG